MATTSGSSSGPASGNSVSCWSSSFMLSASVELVAKEERPGAIVLKNALVIVGNFRLRVGLVVTTGGAGGSGDVTVITGFLNTGLT